VAVTWTLEDSFDILPDRKCAGRSTNRGLSDRARVLLFGNTTGLADETRANAHFEQLPPRIYHGKPLMDDDYRYCIVEAVWSPSVPDPDGYSYKFAGAPRTESLPKLGLTPFGRPEMPGFGRIQISVQTCRSALDPPEKDCPEWGN
jgi:hypothetical protein